MNTHILFYNAENNKQNFELSCGVRPWGILLAISKGSFKVTFPDLNLTEIFEPYEIAYIPPGVKFQREIIEPIDFHQFAFQMNDSVEQIGIAAGKLNVPLENVKSTLQSADKLWSIPTKSDKLSVHILERLLIDHFLFSNKGAPSPWSKETLLATEYIQANLSQSLSVNKIAQDLHISHNGLIWKFKNELNMPPQQYISMHRIKRAKQLLLEDNVNMAQIAEKCGFANAYYFSNAFKKSEGISPSDFRKNALVVKHIDNPSRAILTDNE